MGHGKPGKSRNFRIIQAWKSEEFKCRSGKIMFIKKNKLINFAEKIVNYNVPKIKDDYQERWSNMGHGRLRKVIEFPKLKTV